MGENDLKDFPHNAIEMNSLVLPDEIVSKIVLYNSHPCADIARQLGSENREETTQKLLIINRPPNWAARTSISERYRTRKTSAPRGARLCVGVIGHVRSLKQEALGSSKFHQKQRRGIRLVAPPCPSSLYF